MNTSAFGEVFFRPVGKLLQNLFFSNMQTQIFGVKPGHFGRFRGTPARLSLFFSMWSLSGSAFAFSPRWGDATDAGGCDAG
jgi:hypothetical protein